MIWVILIAIIVIILLRFIIDLNKDDYDLRGQTLEEKFKMIVSCLNEVAFKSNGKVTIYDKRSFSLYKEGENQIIHFNYSTGHLTITWKYKYFHKEVVLEKQFNDVRNISLFDQQKITDELIKEMRVIIDDHKSIVIGNRKYIISGEFNAMPEVEEKKNLPDGLKKFINSNYNLRNAVLSQDKTELEKVLNNMNEGDLDFLLNEMIYSDQQAELFRLKAIDKMYTTPKDYHAALKLIEKGLSFEDKEIEPFLYNLKSDCQILLSNYSMALNEMNNAISSLKQNFPDRYYDISDFHKARAKIKRHLNDNLGAQHDMEIAEEYYRLYQDNKPLNENEDDLP